MAKTTINVRQITMTGSAAAMANQVGNGSLTDDAVFMLQQGSNPVQLIKAKDMQEYFSHIDVDTKSDNNEYTILFIDPDVTDSETGGFTILRDSNGYSDLAYNPSTNLLGVSGSLSLKDDSVAINFGADGEVTLTHVADTGLLLNGSNQLQFRDSALKISSSTDGQLDVDADSQVEITAPTVHIVASTALDADVAGFDVDASGAISLSGSSTGEIQTAGALDIDSAAGLSLDGAGGINIGTAANVAVDFHASTLDIDATGAVSIDSATTVILQGNGGASIGDDTESLAYDGSGNVDFDAVALDLDASGAISISGSSTGEIQTAGALDVDSAAGITVDAGAASNFTTTAGALTLDGAAGVNIAGNSSEVDITTSGLVDINSAAFDLDASGALSIDTTSTAAFRSASSLTLSGSALDIDASGGAIDIDATGAITIDSDDTSNGVKIATDLSGVPVTIGHGTSEVTIGDNLVVTGDLTVNGTNTVVNSTVTTIDDPLIVLGQGNSTTSRDLGLILEQSGSSSNVGFFFDSSATEFVLQSGLSEDGTTAGNISLASYADLHLGSLDADSASTIASLKVEDLTSGRVVLAGSGGEIEDNANLTFDGSTLKVVGSISGSANVEMGGNLTVDGNSILGDASSDTLSVLATATFTPTADFDGGLTVAADQSVSGDGALRVVAAGQLDLDASSGKIQLSASGGIELQSAAEVVADIDVDSFYFLDSDGFVKRDVMSDVFQLAKGDGVQVSSAGLFSIDPVELVVMSGSTSNVSGGNSVTLADNHDSAILADSFEVYLNGMLLTKTGAITDFGSNTGDYSVSGVTLTLVDALDSDDVLTVRYIKK